MPNSTHNAPFLPGVDISSMAARCRDTGGSSVLMLIHSFHLDGHKIHPLESTDNDSIMIALEVP